MFLEPPSPRFSIGIDPGKATGYAVYSLEEKRLMLVMATDFWDAYGRVLCYAPALLSRVVIEVPDTKHVWQGAAKSQKALQRQGVNVGSVIREAELLAEGLERVGYPVKRVPPRKKIAADIFEQHTGWTARTNQHGRDAAMLCYGR